MAIYQVFLLDPLSIHKDPERSVGKIIAVVKLESRVAEQTLKGLALRGELVLIERELVSVTIDDPFAPIDHTSHFVGDFCTHCATLLTDVGCPSCSPGIPQPKRVVKLPQKIRDAIARKGHVFPMA